MCIRDRPFKVDGYEIMYPGDTSAPGYLVYNCRCTVIAEVDGVDMSGGQRRSNNGAVKDMSFREWVKEKGGY